MRNNAAARQADQQYSNDMATAKLQRQWNIEDRDEARAYSRDVYKHMVTDAEASGINPLTALRSGGGANYNAAAGFAPLTRQAPNRQAPQIESVGAAGISGFLENFDPFADAAREKNFALIDAQIRNLDAVSGAIHPPAPGGFHTPGMYGSNQRDGRPSAKPAQLSDAKYQPPEREPTTLTNPYPPEWDWEVAPAIPDAAAWEDRLGDDVGGIGGGIYTFKRDYEHNQERRRKAIRERVTPALQRRSDDYRRKARERHERLRKEVLRNARDLGFK